MDKEKNEKNNQHGLILLVLGVATVLVALIGATFAYFTAVVTKTNGDQSVLVTTRTLYGVTYAASDPISLVDAVPGDNASTTFTISADSSNPAGTTVKYSLKFVPVIDDFTTTDGDRQLIVTISGGSLDSAVELNYTDGANAGEQVILSDATLASGETDEYTVRLDFVETHSNQNSNQTKNFAGYITVSEEITTTTSSN